MVPRLAAGLALLCATTLGLAQSAKTIKLEFGEEGKRLVWIQPKGEARQPADAQSVSGKSVVLELVVDGQDMVVYVCDTVAGTVATRPLKDVAKTGSWAVKPDEAKLAYRVDFRLVHDGKPVAAAVVKMASSGSELESLVTPSDDGVARFAFVPFGDAEVTVDYKVGDDGKSLAAQVFEVKAGMDPIEIEITDEVETVAATAPSSGEGAAAGGPTGAATKKEEEPRKTNPFSTFLNMMIGLLVIGGIAYAVWRFVQANPDKATDILQKGGVQIPAGPQDGGMHPPAKPGPPQQIILDDAAPTPADPVAAAAVPAVKNPRLVKADGSLYIVQDGEQTVGREGGDLTLAGESSVSRSHARLSKSGDAVTIEDAGSTNGTFVNGQRLSGAVALRPGDSVQFGAVQYRYEE